MQSRENALPRGDSRQRAGRTGRNNTAGWLSSSAYSTPKPAAVEGLLHRLGGVRPAGADRWTAPYTLRREA